MFLYIGADGADGADGVGCTVAKSSTISTVTCGSGSVDIFDGVGGPAGADGADGVGCSVEKNGTTATVTCAMGSVDVLNGAEGAIGPAGPQGPQGPQGPAGADGAGGDLIGKTLVLDPSVPTSRAGSQFNSDTAGSNQGHENRQPSLGINFIIALQGVFPERNRRLGENDLEEAPDNAHLDQSHRRLGANPFLGEIAMFGGTFAPRNWALCDGQLLPISTNSALFSILGTSYGGDGRTTFGLPDLRGRVGVHAGTGPGLSSYSIGQKNGVERVALTVSELPGHHHAIDEIHAISISNFTETP